MKITPLISHAAARIPRITDMFSNNVTADISAVSGGVMTIDCATPHGFETSEKVAVCIGNAQIELAIISAVADGDEAILEFSAPHGLVANSVIPRTRSWNSTIELAGFPDSLMNGEQTFASIVSATECRIKLPNGAVPTPDADSVMLEPNNTILEGWRPVTVIDETTLEAPSGLAVTRDVTAKTVSIATNIRIWGALNFEAVRDIYSQDGAAVNELRMFISPLSIVTMSKDRNAKTSATAEHGPGIHFRQTLLDGFSVVVVIPTNEDMGSLQASDMSQGPALGAILKTFQGLTIEHPDLPGSGSFSAVLKAHSGGVFIGPYYVHEYEFESPISLTNQSAIKSSEITTGGITETVAPEDIDDIQPAEPIGSTPFGEISFDGIHHGDTSQPLTASIQYED